MRTKSELGNSLARRIPKLLIIATKQPTRAAYALALVILVACTGVSCRSKPSQAPNPPAAPEAKAPAPEPAKLLLRKRTTGRLALDGFLWQFALAIAVDQATPEVKDLIVLSPGPELAVESEWIEETKMPLKEKGKQKKEPSTWKLDPKNFEFLVSWSLDQQEESKFFFADPLRITSKETWKIEKITDPSVAKTWTCSYVLDGGGQLDKDAIEKAAKEQTEKVIVPARGSILKEIRAFVEANKSGPGRTN